MLEVHATSTDGYSNSSQYPRGKEGEVVMGHTISTGRRSRYGYSLTSRALRASTIAASRGEGGGDENMYWYKMA